MSASEIHDAERPPIQTIEAIEGIKAADSITMNLGWQGSLCFKIPCSSHDAIREAATMAQCKTMWWATVITAIETTSGTPIKMSIIFALFYSFFPQFSAPKRRCLFLKIRNHAVKVFVGIIGPQRIRKIEFGIGGLPQQNCLNAFHRPF